MNKEVNCILKHNISSKWNVHVSAQRVSTFPQRVTWRHWPVEQGDRAAGHTVSGVHAEAQPVREDVRGEPASLCWIQLWEALPRRAVPCRLRTQQTQGWGMHLQRLHLTRSFVVLGLHCKHWLLYNYCSQLDMGRSDWRSHAQRCN